jgi:hypothetical protein
MWIGALTGPIETVAVSNKIFLYAVFYLGTAVV